MSYQALYRAWRPQQFADLVGQPHVKQTLTNALAQRQVAHAYLFCGPRGTGKTTVAKVLAKAVNCESPIGVEPCNTCSACISITNGSNVDVEEIDAASNRGVDEIRQLRDSVQYSPASLRKKVYIVDEVHMLTTEAFNALLKTLEEPPSHALFLLATTEAHKIPGTIVSRCQRFDFRRIPVNEMVARLTQVCVDEGWAFDEAAVWKIAETADGGLRDALGILEQTAAYGEGKVSDGNVALVVGGVENSALLALFQALTNSDLLAVVEQLGQWYVSGKEASRIAYDVLQMLRELLVLKLSPLRQHEATDHALKCEIAERCSTEWFILALQKLGETYTGLRYVEQPRLALEAALLGIAASPNVPQNTPLPKSQPVAVQLSPQEVSEQSAEHIPGRTTERVPSPTPRAGKGTQKSTAVSSAARKQEVLFQWMAEANVDVLTRVVSSWNDILQHVKGNRIQTHAWLMNGKAVLATTYAVVFSFSSRIHRDAVMKSEERQAIEAAIQAVTGLTLQIFALLQTDWDEFTKRSSTNANTTVDSKDIAAQAIALFGKERVYIQYEE